MADDNKSQTVANGAAEVALAGALGVTLTGLTEQVADDLRRHQGVAAARPSGPVMLALAA